MNKNILITGGAGFIGSNLASDLSQLPIRRIAVLMTCHNRRDKTLRCLRALFAQTLPRDMILRVYLVDDGSSDGTAEAVASDFRKIRILKGDGSLYWCGGTRKAWAEAMKSDYDAYLWLNDDVVLLPGAIICLLETDKAVRHEEGRAGIIVGSCRDSETKKHTYGGLIRKRSRIRIPDKPVLPGEKMVPCDAMNGNVVLVTREAFRVLGNLCPEYSHSIGDADYGMVARRDGIPVWVAPGYLGECTYNTYTRKWINPKVPLRQRLNNMCSPLGLPPKEWYVYVRRHTGMLWPLYFIKPIVRVFLPGLWKWKSE